MTIGSTSATTVLTKKLVAAMTAAAAEAVPNPLMLCGRGWVITMLCGDDVTQPCDFVEGGEEVGRVVPVADQWTVG